MTYPRHAMTYAGYIGYNNKSLFDAQGQEYDFVTLTSGGIKAEGANMPAWFDTYQEAWDAYEKQYNQLHRDSGFGTSYWRIYPHVVGWGSQYVVTSRLLISKKKLYNDPDMGYETPDTATPITDVTINDYVEAPYGDLAGDISHVRYEMEQLEKDVQRYEWVVKHPRLFAKIVDELAEHADKKRINLVIDPCLKTPSMWMQAPHFNNLLRTVAFSARTADTFAEQLERAKTKLPAVLPTILAGPIK